MFVSHQAELVIRTRITAGRERLGDNAIGMDSINPKVILLFFVFCAVLDFGWGYLYARSAAAGVVGIVLGLFGTVYFLLVFRKPR